MRKQERQIRNRKQKTTLIVILATFLVVGYATFAQPLAYNTAIKLFKKVTDVFDFGNKDSNDDNTVNGGNNSNNDNNTNNKGNKTSDLTDNNDVKKPEDDIPSTTPEKWNIKFTKAVTKSVHGYARELKPVKFDALSVYFDVVLTGPGDEINYDFTITNGGIMNTKVDQIIVVPETNDDSVIAYDISGIELEDRLYPGESVNMKVRIYYNDKIDPNTIYYNDTLKVVVNFAQD